LNRGALIELRQFELEGRLGDLKGNVKDLQKSIRELENKVAVPARQYLAALDPKTEKTHERQEQELRAQFAPYFALNRLLLAIGGHDRTVQVVNRVTDSALNMSMLASGIASGIIKQPEKLIEFGIHFVGLWSFFADILNQSPSDTQLILDEIQKVRQDIAAL